VTGRHKEEKRREEKKRSAEIGCTVIVINIFYKQIENEE
jgi:hypothetical protein